MDRAGGWRDQAVDGFEECGFAGTAAAEEDDGFTFLDVEGDVTEDGAAGQGAGEVADFEQGIGHALHTVANREGAARHSKIEGMRYAVLAVPAILFIGGAAFFFAGARASSVRPDERVRLQAPPVVSPQELLADESDREVIRRYLAVPVLSDLENGTLVRAAGRRYMRRKLSFQEGERMVVAGMIAPAAIDGLRKEMEAARRVCDVAERLGQTQAMAAAAQSSFELELRLANMPSMKGLAEKYDGSGSFGEADLETLEAEFKTAYGRALPVSSRGGDSMHRSMGLDHSGRYDVALNPSAPEGVWVRRYLVGKGVAFLAFRSAVRGQATGAHIHIGRPSTRTPKA